ncbi:MAG: (deoxy)nucleoside triphosphate pyrophosphohydrolase [Candidatus Pacebacteria bacterium]|nr:(deoxy)nucleoside triphosphate pyrophosphohydrolase [Candidatus Paceibacterota bacterium]
MKPIDVCAAVIARGNRLLLAQRPNGVHLGGKWEFPGGKVHRNETREECIIREIQEELNLEVRSPVFLTTTCHDSVKKSVRLHFLQCELDEDAEHELRAHDDIGWFTLAELETLDLAPADHDFVHWLRAHTQACFGSDI